MERMTKINLNTGEYELTSDSKSLLLLYGVYINGEYTCTASGPFVDKLAAYENIHPDPEYVREIFYRYMDLCK